MTSFLKYFLYRFKSVIAITLLLCAVVTIFCVSVPKSYTSSSYIYQPPNNDSSAVILLGSDVNKYLREHSIKYYYDHKGDKVEVKNYSISDEELFKKRSSGFAFFVLNEEVYLVKGIQKSNTYIEYNYEHLIIISLFCGFIAIFEQSGYKNKRNSDLLLSLPINRYKMALAHYLNGLIQTFFITAPFFIVLFIKYLCVKNDPVSFDPTYILPWFSATLFINFTIFSLVFFICNIANNHIDALMFIAGYFSILLIGESLFREILYNYNYNIYKIYNEFFSTRDLYFFDATKIVSHFSSVIKIGTFSYGYTIRFKHLIKTNVIVFALTSVGSIIMFTRQKAENIGNISNSIFGYKLLLPLLQLIFTLACLANRDYIMTLLITVIAFIGYMIYRRSFKIKLVDYISLGATAVISVVLHFLLLHIAESL